MADVKEGRKRVAVVDNLIKRLRARGELNIQPVRHFGPKYGQRHNPYANGVKKYELTGAGIYREDIACANPTGTGTTTTSDDGSTANTDTVTDNHSSRHAATATGGQQHQACEMPPEKSYSTARQSSASGSSHAGRSGGQSRRSRRTRPTTVPTSSNDSSNDFLYPAKVIVDHIPQIHGGVGGDRLESRDRSDDLGHDLFLGMQSCSGTSATDSSSCGSPTLDHQVEGCPADEMVSVVEGDEAGQSDMYLCRLDNGFAQETTL